MSLRVKLVAGACGVVLAAGVVLSGSASAASAPPQSQASSSPAAGAAVAQTTAVNPAAAVTPDSTPPDSWCRSQGPNYFGWFGVAPGSSADGGVADDLWWDAKGKVSPTPMQIYSGNGGLNQQWCESYIGNGTFIFYAYYSSTVVPQCLTSYYGAEHGYQAGVRVWAETCTSTTTGINSDQLWHVCLRSGNSVSLEPALATPSSVWLDVWGGSSDNGKSAFVPMNPLQLWGGNGQDNQRFTLYPSPGEPDNLIYDYTTGVAGC